MSASTSWEGIKCEEADDIGGAGRSSTGSGPDCAYATNKEVLLRMSDAYERLAASAAKREGDKNSSDDGSQ